MPRILVDVKNLALYSAGVARWFSPLLATRMAPGTFLASVTTVASGTTVANFSLEQMVARYREVWAAVSGAKDSR